MFFLVRVHGRDQRLGDMLYPNEEREGVIHV
jgi:hypothetical protein